MSQVNRPTVALEPPRSGAENMRIDAENLQRAADGSPETVFRLYQWVRPTVTLGYFQKDDTALPPSLADSDCVKRLTGGGAILHHHELTYSVVTPRDHAARRDPINLYVTIHDQIIAALAEFGVSAAMRRDVQEVEKVAEEPFLCFLRSDQHDIVVNGSKVVGSAQRRRRGCILQHGSILLRTSELTPQIPGLQELSHAIPVEMLSESLGRRFAALPTS